MFDVIVVGAGPAGSAAAKRCAEKGLSVVILEKKKLPREKVCSGMLGPEAIPVIGKEYGELPVWVMAKPSRLSGFIFHVPDIGKEKLECETPLTSRRELDYWMNKKAEAKGAEIWESTQFLGLIQEGGICSVKIRRGGRTEDIQSRFVVGGDGGISHVRGSVFPELRMRYAQVIQERIEGKVELDEKYFHWVYPLEYSPSCFTVSQKDRFVIVDVTGRIGQAKGLMHLAKCFLKKHHLTNDKPIWKGSCLMPLMFKELGAGIFSPAKGNVLLVGDAGNFCLPVSGGGIGSGIQTGLLAGDSIIQAIGSGEEAAGIFIDKVSNIISIYKGMYPWFRRMREARESGGSSLPRILQEAYQARLDCLKD